MKVDSLQLRKDHTYINHNTLGHELKSVITTLYALTSVDMTRVAELREKRNKLRTKMIDLWKIVKALFAGKKRVR